MQPLEPTILDLSVNYGRSAGMSYTGPRTWDVDIRTPPPELVASIAECVRGIAIPFSERYPTMRVARDALVSGDGWCIPAGNSGWSGLLDFDFALGETDHFLEWSKALDPFYKVQAQARLNQYLTQSKLIG